MNFKEIKMLFYIILTLLILVGIGLVVFACLSRKKTENKTDNYFEANASVQLVKQAIDDADNAIEQLNKISSDVFQEFEEKYQELLFLYQMIDDMKEKREKVDFKADSSGSLESENLTERNIFKNPNFEKIKNMQAQGLSVSEISKALNMGQGEVKLILELGKAR